VFHPGDRLRWRLVRSTPIGGADDTAQSDMDALRA
jgi:hypothetical protein